MGSLKRNKRGIIGMIIFFLVLFTILIVGFMAALIVGVLGIFNDNFEPIGAELGFIGDKNVSQVFDYAYAPVDVLIQGLPWIIGLGYAAALIFSIMFAVTYRYNPHPMLMGIYFLLMILLIFGAIIMSNMYQDIYSSTDDLATELKANPITSYLVLYSPLIFTIITFISGVYFFAGPKDTAGDFGI